MSDEAKLFLLKEKLDEVKRKKITTLVTLLVASFILAFYIQMTVKLDFTLGFIIWAFGGGTIGFIVDRYYESQKTEIMRQLEQMAFKNASS